ncbi:hypothetical protein RJ641_018805, partial [Dillenia turbinata]
MGVMRAKSKQALLLWFEGFRKACWLNRVVMSCLRIFILKSVVMPILQWKLPEQCLNLCSQELCSLDGILKLYSFLRLGLIQYLDIAKLGHIAMGSDRHADATTSKQKVYATGLIPFLGKGLNFLFLSWMYKWNLSSVSLEKRLDFFESNWAFFAGFATGSDAELVIGSQQSKWKGA